MQKIICLMEEINVETEKYINSFDDEETEIYIYDSVIESCEEKKIYLAGELFSIFCENDSKCSIVTDVKEVYEIVLNIYYPLFENIDYMEQNVNNRFKDDLDYIELLKFESQIFENGSEKKNVELIMSSLRVLDKEQYSELCNIIQMSPILENKKKMRFYVHLCKALLCANKNGLIQMNVSIMLYLKSMLMQLEKSAENTNEFLGCFIYYFAENEDYCYFVWNQIKRAGLEERICKNKRTNELLDYIYDKCFKNCSLKIKDSIKAISYVEKNKDIVVVMSIQYLSNGHAPTKTIIERCKTLKQMGKRVYFINTTEQYEIYEYVPFFGIKSGKVLEEYYEKKYMDMNGVNIPFYQINREQKITEKYYDIISLINKIKPEYILSIGTGSIIADLCAYSVPCAEMALTFSTVPHTENCIPIIGRKMSCEEKKHLKYDVIESRFTFELKKQTEKFTRKQFDIPEDRFVLVVIGIRLDYDISDKLLKMLSDLCWHNVYIVFAGVYGRYEKDTEKYHDLRENSKFIGYCNDILALMDVCDLYVNPDRVGGGFSIIEAFYKGVPGVYLKKGDVFTAGGEEFAIDTFEEMYGMILKYRDDKIFYEEQSQKAKKRAEYMTSSLEAMSQLDEKIKQTINKTM